MPPSEGVPAQLCSAQQCTASRAVAPSAFFCSHHTGKTGNSKLPHCFWRDTAVQDSTQLASGVPMAPRPSPVRSPEEQGAWCLSWGLEGGEQWRENIRQLCPQALREAAGGQA